MHNPSIAERPFLEFTKSAITKANQSKYVSSTKDTGYDKSSDLTVAIVAYNETDLLVDLIKKLEGQIKEQSASIVVLDNGLEAEIVQKITRSPMLYIKASDNLGCTLGRNVASAYVETPLMAFIDADARIDDNYIEQAIASMQDASVVSARGKVRPITAGTRIPPSYDLGDETFAYYPNAEGISVWRTKDYRKVGGFEASLYGGEGVVLCHRMIELYGYTPDQFIYYPKLVLRHDYSDDPGALYKKALRSKIYRWHVDRKYPLLANMLTEYDKATRGVRVAHFDHGSRENTLAMDRAEREFQAEVQDYSTALAARRWNNPDKPDKNGKYKFTVVLPCYNLGSLVEKAVKSVMAQTLNSIEIIVVDDVSPDTDTQEVLKKLEGHIKVIYRKKNGGASAARNTGVEAAKADYILCLDSDDTISPTYLEEAYNVLESDQKAGVAGSHVKFIGERQGAWRPHDKIGLPDALIASPIANASAYRKQAWQDAGGYDENLRGMEDWEYWLSILSNNWSIRIIPRQHYIYFTRPGSKVKTSNKNAVDIVSYIVNKHRALFDKHMTYVIAHKHKQHVDQRDQIFRLNEQLNNRKKIADSRARSLAKKTLRKAKYGTRLAIETRDPALIAQHVKKNVGKIARKIKSKL